MKTLTSFCRESHLPTALIRAVVRQLGGWNEDTRQALQDIARHGVDGGFIYYSDTTAFAKKHKAVILEVAEELAREVRDTGGAVDLIADFRCLRDGDITPSITDIARVVYSGKGPDSVVTEVYNALAWFAAEEVARAYSDLIAAQ